MVWGWEPSPPIQADKRVFCSTEPRTEKSHKGRGGGGTRTRREAHRLPQPACPPKARRRGPRVRLGAPGPRLNGEAALIYEGPGRLAGEGGRFVFGTDNGPQGGSPGGRVLPRLPSPPADASGRDTVTNGGAAPGDKAGPLEVPEEGIMAGTCLLWRWHTPRADGSLPAGQWPPPRPAVGGALGGALSRRPRRDIVSTYLSGGEVTTGQPAL